jgi:signal transduction histidine kinase
MAWPLFNVLRFAEAHILREQLRLLLDNVVSSTLPVVLLSLMMIATLANDSNVMLLLLWFAVVVTTKLASFVVARRYQVAAIPLVQGQRLASLIVTFYTINGLAWGALPWVALDTASPAGRVIILAVMAGTIGSAMAQTSLVLPVFMAFATTTLGLVMVKLLLMDDPVYRVLSVAIALYFFSLLSLARNNASASLAAITLHFENTELLEQLRIKTGVAETARREAERANLDKSKFLAAASHDLRQPVHAQGLFLSVLARSTLTAPQRELVDNIRKSSDASSEMLNTLLDFSRIEAGVIKPQLQRVPLQPLLNKLEAELAPQADAKGLVYRSRESRFAVYSDPALLELILRNLISNAIRYTDHGGILVGARRRGPLVLLEVWDTGIGIEAGQQQEVFREFHQLGNPERDSRKGLGLGLAIVEGLAHTLNYPLSLASVPARGSVFRLMLPLDGETIRTVQTAISLPMIGTLNARVLIIDDEEAVRVGMLYLLRDWGCECQAAESIEEALAIVQSWSPEVIVSDYRLREQRTGSEAIRAVRAALGQELPALLITGDTAPERLREAEASGVPLLHKPVSANELYQTMVMVLPPE